MILDEQIDALVTHAPDYWQLDACGVTRTAREIPVLLHRAAYLPAADRMQALLIGGLSGELEDVNLALEALKSYHAYRPRLSARIGLSAVPCGNPDGLALGVAPENGAGGNPSAGYPPTGNFFYDPANPEAHSIWRWVSFQAPDLVIEVRARSNWRATVARDESASWEASAPCLQLWPQLCSALNTSELTPDSSLLGALATGKPNGLAPVPGLRLACPADALQTELGKLWALLNGASATTPDRREVAPAKPLADNHSDTRRALEARSARTPLAVARALAATYGHQLDPVIYTQGVAISGRLRLAQLDAHGVDPTADIAAVVEPYARFKGRDGSKALFAAGADGGANLAGLVWADELTAATGDSRYADLLVHTADRYRSTHDNDVPIPSHPDYQVEDMFFSAAVLGRAFKLTGDENYLRILTRFLLDAEIQQADGLFWHDRSTPYYWGRGNGFAALSYAETLTYMPDSYPERAAVLAIHLRHLEALRQYQHPSGMWHQVINVPGSYLEMSSTCMIGYALARGMRRGWLDADAAHRDALMQAWQGVAARIDDNGGLVDVCTGTGVQQSLRDYLDRPAIFGPDERGGALALWFTTEMESFLNAVSGF